MANKALNPTNYGSPSSEDHDDDKVFIFSNTDSEIRTVPRYQPFVSCTTAQMNALSSPQAGWVIYNSSEGEPFFYNGSDWVSLVDGLPEA
jgi:hypothetical protein